MPIRERLDDLTKARRWDQELPLNYVYTLGVSGDKFAKGLKDGILYASKCTNCGSKFLPPKSYCTKCYEKIESYIGLHEHGVVSGLTEAGNDIFAYVTFKGVTGGMVHRLLKPAKVGSKVIPRFASKKDRKGSISDLIGFEPV
jgi:uncharacterized OB-fold protein